MISNGDCDASSNPDSNSHAHARPRVGALEVPPHGTFDVTVGQGFAFVSNTVNISLGDMARWTWASSGHSVCGGHPCAVDGQFVRLTILTASAGTLSNAGTVYEVTFTKAATYSYFCAAYCSISMTGVINVAP